MKISCLIFFAVVLCWGSTVLAQRIEQDQSVEMTILQNTAEQGNSSAQKKLGLIYFNAAMPFQNKEAGARWLMKAAEKGDVEAERYVGWMYAYGEGLEKDKEKAVFWYRKAAEHGDPQAQGNLGRRFLRGEGVAQDYRQALSWFTKAAEQGDPTSQYDLGLMYAKGEGVKPDLSAAKEWFKKAANQGIRDANVALSRLEIEEKGNSYAGQRKKDVYFLASLLEEYKDKVGHYPFFDPNPVASGYVKVGRLVAIGTPSAEKALTEKPNPFGISISKTPSVNLAYELEKVLRRQITLPVDPQEVALYAPNAYYIYFLPNDDEYLIMTFLYQPEENTSKLWNEHANVYAISSSEKVTTLNFWKSMGIKPQIYRDMRDKDK